VFSITLHLRDLPLLQQIQTFFGVGNLNKTGNTATYRVTDLNQLIEVIIPFFNKYPIQGCKQLDYLDFCQIAFFMKDKVHLTEKGLNQIKEIKSRMNTNRQYELD
jgi:hypothetical protein